MVIQKKMVGVVLVVVVVVVLCRNKNERKQI